MTVDALEFWGIAIGGCLLIGVAWEWFRKNV